ncbi:hypothetical protein ANA_C10697 [Anabaena sp. 90]|nr:hypothetical protein ANA_C10697 [Anabaena sp. 90]
MANIRISNLENTDEKKFIINLSNLDAVYVFGGEYNNASQILNYGVKALEFVLVIYAIDAISLLTKTFRK